LCIFSATGSNALERGSATGPVRIHLLPADGGATRIALRIALDTGKILDAWCPVVEKRFGCWLPAGGSWVRIQPEGWVPQIRKLRLRPEQEVDLGRLRFARGGGVRGRVLLADNAPCPQCSIEIEPFTASEGGIRGAPAIERSLCVARSATDEHGSFRALGLAPGTYLLRATADGQVATDRTTVRGGPAVPMAPRALFQQPLATTPAAWCVPRALSRLCCVFARARAGVAHLAAGTGSEVGTAALAGSRMLAAGCLVASFFGALRTIDDWHASCSS